MRTGNCSFRDSLHFASIRSDRWYMLQPNLIKVQAEDNYMLRLWYETGEEKLFDVKPYIMEPHIKGTWFGELLDEDYFKQVRVMDDGYGITWPHEQDLAPHELYELSEPV